MNQLEQSPEEYQQEINQIQNKLEISQTINLFGIIIIMVLCLVTYNFIKENKIIKERLANECKARKSNK